jgi:SH3 domain-containing YSC84-like protein 1
MHRRIAIPAAMALSIALFVFHGPAALASNASAAQGHVNAAARVVNRMQQVPHLAHLLQRAHGVFIVPRYGKGGFIIGGQGGAGVVLVRNHGQWSDPAFYNIAGGSIGLQAGGGGGSVAMLLMTPQAVHQFESNQKWSLHGNAGLTVANYSGRAGAHSGGASDVIIWSDVAGLYGGLTAGVTHISPDMQLDRAYYHGHTAPRRILMGAVHNSRANVLRDALATRVASK